MGKLGSDGMKASGMIRTWKFHQKADRTGAACRQHQMQMPGTEMSGAHRRGSPGDPCELPDGGPAWVPRAWDCGPGMTHLMLTRLTLSLRRSQQEKGFVLTRIFHNRGHSPKQILPTIGLTSHSSHLWAITPRGGHGSNACGSDVTRPLTQQMKRRHSIPVRRFGKRS